MYEKPTKNMKLKEKQKTLICITWQNMRRRWRSFKLHRIFHHVRHKRLKSGCSHGLAWLHSSASHACNVETCDADECRWALAWRHHQCRMLCYMRHRWLTQMTIICMEEASCGSHLTPRPMQIAHQPRRFNVRHRWFFPYLRRDICRRADVRRK